MIIEIRDLPNQKIKSLSVNITFEDDTTEFDAKIIKTDEHTVINEPVIKNQTNQTKQTKSVQSVQSVQSELDTGLNKPVIPDCDDRLTAPVPAEMRDLEL